MSKLASLRTSFGQHLASIAELRTKAEADDASSDDKSSLETAITRGFDLKAEIEAEEQREARHNELVTFGKSGGDWAPVIAPHNDRKNTRNGVHQFDAAKAVREFYEGRMTGLEAETQATLKADRLVRGLASRGVILPHDAPHKRAALTTSTGAGGVQTSVYPTIFDALMSAMILPGLGVQVLQLDGPTKLPTASAATSYFVTEGNAPSDGSPGLGSVSLSLHTAAARGELTRQMLYSSSLNTQAFMIDYLIKSIAQRIQIGYVSGSNSAGQPKGLLTYTSGDGINTPLTIATDGSALTKASLLQLVAPVANSNAPGVAKWLTNNKVTSKLEGTAQESGYPVYCSDPVSQTIIGRSYVASDVVPSNLTKGSGTGLSAIAYGVWSESVVGLFSGVDVTLGEVTDSGSIPVKVFQDMDVAFLHLAAFSTASGIITA